MTHRPAHEVIDWSDLGHSIFLTPAEAKVAGCKRPLADKSLERIARGVIRHVLEDLNPFVMRVTQKGVSGQVWGVDRPMPTQTTRQDLAVCTPVIASLAHGNNGTNGRRWRDVREPLGGIHAGGNNWGAATPLFQVFRGNAAATRADGPLSTITAGSGPGRGAGAGHAMAMIAPLLAQVGYGEREGQRARTADLRGPLGTCVAGGVKQAIVAPVMATLRNHDTGSRADRPFDTISAGGNHAALIAPLLMQYYGRGETTRPDWVLPTVVTKDRHALVCVVIDGLTWVMVDILFRMLRPDELAAAMGFARSYLFPSQKRQAVQLIGNAVAPPVGEALLMAALPGGRAA